MVNTASTPPDNGAPQPLLALLASRLHVPEPVEIAPAADWSEESETLLPLSLLRDLDDTTPLPPPPTPSLIAALFQDSVSRGLIPREEQLEFFSTYCGLNCAPMREGLLWETALQNVIQEGKQDSERGRASLAQLSSTLHARLKRLESKEAVTLFGTATRQAEFSKNQLIQQWIKELLPGEWSRRVCNGEVDSYEALARHLIDDLSSSTMQELYSYIPASTGNQRDFIQEVLLKKGLHSVLPNFLQGGIVAKAAEKLSDSLKAHFKKKILESFPIGCRRDAAAFASHIVEHGLQRAIEIEMERASGAAAEFVSQFAQNIQQSVVDELPAAAKLLLQNVGVAGSDGGVYLTVEKQENGKFTLTVHGMNEALQHHPKEQKKRRVELRYVDISEEEMSADFIFRFLSLRAWPAWSKEASFSLAQIYKGLLGPLKSRLTPAIPVDFHDENENEPLRTPFDLLMHRTIGKNGNLSAKGRHLEKFALQKKVFFSVYKAYEADPNCEEKCSQLDQVNQMMMDASLKMHEEKLISENELRAIYATVWEVDRKLHGVKIRQVIADKVDPSLLINAELSGVLKKIASIFGGTPHRLEAIKAALVDLFGDSMKGVIEMALEEIAEPAVEPTVEEEEITLKDVCSKFVSEMRAQAKEMRASFWKTKAEMKNWDIWDFLGFVYQLFNTFRTISFYLYGGKAAHILFDSLDQALLTRYPRYSACRILAPSLVRTVVAQVGPVLAMQLVPKRYKERYNDAVKHVEKTALYYAIKWTLPYFLSKERIEKGNRLAHQLQQQVTRGGELSFQIETEEKKAAKIIHRKRTKEGVCTETTPKDKTTTSPLAAVVEMEASDGRYVPPPFRPHAVEVTKDNVEAVIQKWIKDVHSYDRMAIGMSSEDVRIRKMLYLIEQIKNLPILNSEGKSIWGEVERPQVVLENIYSLMQEIERAAGSGTENGRRVSLLLTIAYFKLFAIADQLARRSEESGLEKFSTCPSELILFVNQMRTRVYCKEDEEQLMEVCRYFKVNPLHTYSYNEYELKKRDSVTDWGEVLFSASMQKREQPSVCLATKLKNELHVNDQPCGRDVVRYLSSLLEMKSTKERLELHGFHEGVSKEDRLLALLEDPCLASDPKRNLSRAEAALFDSSDRRRGTLPRSYYILHRAHQLLSGQFQAIRRGFHIEYDNVWDRLESLPILERAYQAAGPLERLLLYHVYDDPNNSRPPSGVLPLDSLGKALMKELGLKSSVALVETSDGMRGLSQPVFPHNLPANVEELRKTVLDGVDDDSLKGVLRPEEEALNPLFWDEAEGNWSQKKMRAERHTSLSHNLDGLIRHLSFLTKHPEELYLKANRQTLEYLFLRFHLLQDVLDRRPDLVKPIGQFFTTMIAHLTSKADALRMHSFSQLSQEEKERVCEIESAKAQLLRLALYVKSLCRYHTRRAELYFPNLRNWYYKSSLLQSLEARSVSKDNLRNIVECSIFLHADEELIALSPEKKEEFVHDYCLFAALRTVIPRAEFLDADALFWRHEGEIKKYLDENGQESRRDRILTAVARWLPVHGATLSTNGKLKWNGSFPHYTSREFALDLSNSHAVIKPIEVFSTAQLKNAIAKQLGQLVSTLVVEGEGRYSIPLLDITVIVDKERCADESPSFALYRNDGLKSYRFIPPDECHFDPPPPADIPIERGLWVEEEIGQSESEKTARPLVQVGLTVFRATRLKVEGSDARELAINWEAFGDVDRPKEIVDLKKASHGLSLLSWFTPLSEVEAHRYCEGAGEICYLKLREHNLMFDVKECDGKLKATSVGTFPGFFISSHQKNSLATIYSRTLFLENESGDKRMLLANAPVAQLLGSSVASFVGGAARSALFKQLFERRWNSPIDDKATTYYAYTVEKDGSLSSDEPAAMAYLLAHQIARGSWREAKMSLCELEAMGRLALLPKEALETLFSISVYCTFCKDQRASEIGLRLAALEAENLLLPGGKDLTDCDGTDFLKWSARVHALLQYLKRKKGAPPLITEYQELLLLTELSRMSITLAKKLSEGAPQGLAHAARVMGLEGAAETLFLPGSLSSRLRALRKKHAVTGETTLGKLEVALRLAGFGKSESSKADAMESRLNIVLSKLDTKALTEAALEKVKELGDSSPEELSSDEEVSTLGNSALLRCAEELALLKINPPWTMLKASEMVELLNPKEWADLLDVTTPLEEAVFSVPTTLQDYFPGDFSRSFHAYYALAMNSPPGDIGEDAVRGPEFIERRHRLSALLEKLSLEGKHREALLAQLLMTLMSNEVPSGLPTSNLFREKLKSVEVNGKEDLSLFKATLIALCQHCLSVKRTQAFFEHTLAGRVTKLALTEGVKTATHYVIKNRVHCAIKSMCVTLAAPLVALDWGVSALRWGKSSYDLLQRIRSIYEEGSATSSGEKRLLIAEDASSAWKLRLLPSGLSTAMKKLDDHFSDLLQEIQGRYFEAPQNEHVPETSPVHPGEGSDPITRHVHAEFNQSCFDYDARDRGAPLRKTPKRQEAARQTFADLSAAEKELKAQVESEGIALLEFANSALRQKAIEPPTTIVAMERLKRGDTKVQDVVDCLDPKELSLLFLEGDMEAWEKKTRLQREQCEELQEKMYLHLVKVTRLNQLTKCCQLAKRAATVKQPSELEVECLLEELAIEMQRTRAYDVATLPERLIRTHLIFETANKTMLWQGQADQEDRMLLHEGKKLVLQLIMGSGKTAVAIPHTNYMTADGKKIMVNIWPSAAAPVSTKQTAWQSLRTYAQKAHALHFDRSTELSMHRLWALLKRLGNSAAAKEQINLTKEEMQALELRMILLANKIKELSSPMQMLERETLKEELFYLGKILHILRTVGVANIDEVHEVLSRKKELNFPCGSASTVRSRWSAVIYQVLFFLSQTAEFKDILNLREDQKPLPEALYEARVLPVLAKKIAEWPLFNFASEDQEEVIQYLSGKATKIPEAVLNHSARADIDLIKGTLTIFLPKALELKPGEHYGPSKKDDSAEFARPFDACDQPNEKATIRSPFEAIVKTYLAMLYRRITPVQARKLAMIWKARAEATHKRKGIPFANTKEAKLFAKLCPGYTLNAWHLMPKGKLHEFFSKSDEAVLHYGMEATKQIRYFKQNIKSNSKNFASQFSSFYADSGTLFNHQTYPRGTEVLWDKGTEGETKHLLQIKQTVNSIQIVKENNPVLVLKEMLRGYFMPGSYHFAIVDCGALFRGLSNKKAAEETLAFIEKERKDLQGVVYYNDDHEPMVLQVGGGEAIPLSRSTLPPEKRITIFDQAHTFASNVPQPLHGMACTTVGEGLKKMSFEQAVWRMRGLRKKQAITLLVKDDIKDQISSKAVPTLEEIYAYVMRNEAKQCGEDNYQSDRQEIHDVVRRAVLDKMYSVYDELEKEQSGETGLLGSTMSSAMNKFMNIYTEFQDLLVSEDSDDPTTLFGAVDTMEEPKVLLETYQAALFSRIHASSTFSLEEKRAIWAKMKGLSDGVYSGKVRTYVRENGDYDVAAFESVGQEQAIEVNQDNDKEAEKETELDVQMDQDLDQQRQMLVDLDKRRDRFHRWSEPMKWNSNLDIADLSWLKFEDFDEDRGTALARLVGTGTNGAAAGLYSATRYVGSYFKSAEELEEEKKKEKIAATKGAHVPLYSFREFLSQSKNGHLREAVSAFDPNLFCSHNFAPALPQGLFSCAMDPLAGNRKLLTELLIIEEKDAQGNIKRRVGLVDHSDVDFWRAKLRKKMVFGNVRIALYNIGLQVITGSSDRLWKNDELLQDPSFLNAVVQAKFYNADVKYSAEEKIALKNWIKKSGPLKMKKLFEAIRQYRVSPNELEGSDLDDVFVELIETLDIR